MPPIQLRLVVDDPIRGAPFEVSADSASELATETFVEANSGEPWSPATSELVRRLRHFALDCAVHVMDICSGDMAPDDYADLLLDVETAREMTQSGAPPAAFAERLKACRVHATRPKTARSYEAAHAVAQACSDAVGVHGSYPGFHEVAVSARRACRFEEELADSQGRPPTRRAAEERSWQIVRLREWFSDACPEPLSPPDMRPPAPTIG